MDIKTTQVDFSLAKLILFVHSRYWRSQEDTVCFYRYLMTRTISACLTNARMLAEEDFFSDEGVQAFDSGDVELHVPFSHVAIMELNCPILRAHGGRRQDSLHVWWCRWSFLQNIRSGEDNLQWTMFCWACRRTLPNWPGVQHYHEKNIKTSTLNVDPQYEIRSHFHSTWECNATRFSTVAVRGNIIQASRKRWEGLCDVDARQWSLAARGKWNTEFKRFTSN